MRIFEINDTGLVCYADDKWDIRRVCDWSKTDSCNE